MRGREPREGVIMKNYKQISWQRIAIILLIALFTIGVVACKKQPTQPSASQTAVGNTDCELCEKNEGTHIELDEETENDKFIYNWNSGGDDNFTYNWR